MSLQIAGYLAGGAATGVLGTVLATKGWKVANSDDSNASVVAGSIGVLAGITLAHAGYRLGGRGWTLLNDAVSQEGVVAAFKQMSRGRQIGVGSGLLVGAGLAAWGVYGIFSGSRGPNPPPEDLFGADNVDYPSSELEE